MLYRWYADLNRQLGRSNRYEITDGDVLMAKASRWEYQQALVNAVTALTDWALRTQLGETAPTLVVSYSMGKKERARSSYQELLARI